MGWMISGGGLPTLDSFSLAANVKNIKHKDAS